MSAEIDQPRKLGLSFPFLGLGRRNSADEPRQVSDHVATVVVVAAIVLLMQIGSAFIPAYILPSPLSVMRSLAESLATDYGQILITLLRLVISLLISIAVGTAIGIITGTIASVRPFLRALVIIDTGIPALSWMLMAVFWFKDPELRMFFIMFVIVVPIYALNVHDGIRAMSKEWLEMCESFRPTRLQVLRYLIIPHVVPYVLMTTKSTVGYATRMLIFAELIGSSVGIGARMGLAQATFHMESVIAWTVLLVVMNMMAQGTVGLLERYLLRWRDEAAVR
ncbi:MAG TPA: ABC transporter permease subunit [Xanthobacteraceae bacterium]|nr:ABC transporter permease subunit [Xanthobacteraceae bacterium]